MTNAALLGSFGDASLSPMIFRNKIINGDMAIYQRGAATTVNEGVSVDRWVLLKTNGATESVAQNSDAPSGVGFQYSLRNTISTGDASIASTEYSGLMQKIEGYQIRDLNFGTSSAKPVTIQFWIRSSVTGTYTGNIGNSDASRMCPFNFTINAANTWEFKTVTLPGCTDGTWNTTTNIGLYLRIYAALGSSFLGGTAGVWNSATQYGSGTPVNGIASNGNIFAVTGVQLEAGLAPTPFEFLPLQTQINLCQRYFVGLYGESGRTTIFGQGLCESTTLGSCSFGTFPTPMRIAPTAAIGGGLSLYGASAAGVTNNYSSISVSTQRSSTTQGTIYFAYTGGYPGGAYVAYTATTGLQVTFTAEF
jgi:hypothetical protein